MSEKDRAGKIQMACNEIYKIVLGERRAKNVIAFTMTKENSAPIIAEISAKHNLNGEFLTRLIYGL